MYEDQGFEEVDGLKGGGDNTENGFAEKDEVGTSGRRLL